MYCRLCQSNHSHILFKVFSIIITLQVYCEGSESPSPFLPTLSVPPPLPGLPDSCASQESSEELSTFSVVRFTDEVKIRWKTWSSMQSVEPPDGASLIPIIFFTRNIQEPWPVCLCNALSRCLLSPPASHSTHSFCVLPSCASGNGRGTRDSVCANQVLHEFFVISLIFIILRVPESWVKRLVVCAEYD